MRVVKLHSIMERAFPKTSIIEITEILNDLIDDGEDLLNGAKFEYIDIVDGQRFYKLKGSAIDVKSMLFQNKNSAFIPINRLIGKTDTGDID